jgi:hypothetical protein
MKNRILITSNHPSFYNVTAKSYGDAQDYVHKALEYASSRHKYSNLKFKIKTI